MQDNNELTELLKVAAEPHLIASAAKANETLAKLNAYLTDLRLMVSELELMSDFHYNEIQNELGLTVDQKKSKHKVSDPYRLWQKRKGELSDLRAIRRNLERHADLLTKQELYKPKYENRAYTI